MPTSRSSVSIKQFTAALRQTGHPPHRVTTIASSAGAVIFTHGVIDDCALKPYQPRPLDRALQPARASGSPTVARIAGEAPAVRPGPVLPLSSQSLFLPSGRGGGRLVTVGEIIAIRSAENYSEVWLDAGEFQIVRHTMQAWVRWLPAELFARIHRQVIVNLSRMERVERGPNRGATVFLRGLQRPLPVGRRMWPRLKARICALEAAEPRAAG